MTNPFALWEIALYGFVATTPFVIMSILTFRDSMRFNMRITVLIAVLTTFFKVMTDISVYYIPPAFYPLIDLSGGVIYFFSLFLLFKGPAGKLAFYLISLSNFSNLYVILAKYIESRISMEWALMRYHWTFSLCMFAVEAVLLPVMYKILYRPLVELDNRPENRRMWYYLWLVPSTFTLIWMLMFYDSGRSALERMTSGSSYLLYKALIDVGSLLIYELIIMLVRRSNENLELMEKTFSQKIELAHYKTLNEQINSTRRARHDLKLHLGVIQDFAKANGDEKVVAYTEELLDVPSLKNPILYCENTAANSVLQFYLQEAESKGIRTSVDFVMPEAYFVRTTDIATLLGNLLKNSLEACQREAPADPYIRIKGAPVSPTTFTLLIENPSEKVPDSNNQGYFLSHNHKGPGLGLQSVQSIVDRYAGTLRIQHENDIFRVSVILYQQSERGE